MELEFIAQSVNNFIHITQQENFHVPITREINEISKWEDW